MVEIDTKRIRVGPVTQQYVDSCLWLVERARGAQGAARQALEDAARLSQLVQQLPAEAEEERLRASLALELALGRVVARVLEAEVLIQDGAAYLRHLNGNAENSREAVSARAASAKSKGNGRGGSNGNGASPG